MALDFIFILKCYNLKKICNILIINKNEIKKIKESICKKIDENTSIANGVSTIDEDFVKSFINYDIREYVNLNYSNLTEDTKNAYCKKIRLYRDIFMEEVSKRTGDVFNSCQINDYIEILNSYFIDKKEFENDKYVILKNKEKNVFVRINKNEKDFDSLDSIYISFYTSPSKKVEQFGYNENIEILTMHPLERIDSCFLVIKIKSMPILSIDSIFENYKIEDKIYSDDILSFNFDSVSDFSCSVLGNSPELLQNICHFENDLYFNYFKDNSSYYNLSFFKFKDFLKELDYTEKEHLFYKDMFFLAPELFYSDSIKEKAVSVGLEPNLLYRYYSNKYKIDLKFTPEGLNEFLKSLNDKETYYLIENKSKIENLLFTEEINELIDSFYNEVKKQSSKPNKLS